MGLHHHGGVVIILGIPLQHLGLRFSFGSPGNPVGTVDFPGYRCHSVSQFHLHGIQESEFVLFVAGIHHRIGKFQGPFAALGPMLGHRAPRPRGFGVLPHQGNFIPGVGMECIDADHRIDPRFPDRVDVVDHVGNALFEQLQVFLDVGLGQGNTRHYFGPAAVHLESANGRREHGHMRLQTTVAALDIPELLKADIRRKPTLGDMIIEHLEADPVGNDGRLADGDVGKGSGVNHAGLILGGTHEGRIDGIAHPGGHGISHFQIAGCHGIAAPVKSYGDVVQAFLQVRQVSHDRQNRHQFGADGNPEFGLHHVSVHAAAHADDNVAQRLGTEIHDPAHFDPGGIDLQTTHPGEPLQLLVGVVPLVLHPGRKSHHGQIVRIHDIVDITGQPHGKFGHGDEQRIAPAGGSSFDIHGGPA